MMRHRAQTAGSDNLT